MLRRINRKRGRLNSLIKDKKNVLGTLRELKTGFIHINTVLDGGKLSLKDIKHILETRDSILEKGKKFQVITLNHLQAQRYLSDPEVKDRTITVDDILEVHRRLTIFADMQAGKFRVDPFSKKEKVSGQLEKVIEGVLDGKKRHAIEQGALFYSFFEKIRPFNFGNGLTARVLMKHIINRGGYLFGLQLNDYEVKYFRKCVDQARNGVHRPFVNVAASCTERAFDLILDSLNTPIEEEPEEEELIQWETQVDVNYVFDLVLGGNSK